MWGPIRARIAKCKMRFSEMAGGSSLCASRLRLGKPPRGVGRRRRHSIPIKNLTLTTQLFFSVGFKQKRILAILPATYPKYCHENRQKGVSKSPASYAQQIGDSMSIVKVTPAELSGDYSYLAENTR